MIRYERVAADHVVTAPLDGIEIVRGGDGRTVIAYAAMFATPYEVNDQFGHYDEIVNRSAFNRVLGAARNFHCLFNHGRDLYGNPSDRYSMPLGTPIEVKPDGKGLLTRTRYSKTDLADEVLELIRDGAITSQSFRGAIYKSAPARPGPNGRPIIERYELGLKDYGPAPFAINMDAAIIGVRSVSDIAGQIIALSPTERAELVSTIGAIDLGTLDEETPDALADPPEPDKDEETPDVPRGSSLTQLELEAANRRRQLQGVTQ